MNNPDKTILLVEDDPINEQLVTKWLSLEGYNVCCADTGEKAIETVNAKASLIDMILMDIDLGYGMDGTEAARIILKDHDIPVIFLSSHTEKEVIDKIEEITSYGFVVKSAGNTVLLASIRMAFKLFDANRERNRTHEQLTHSYDLLRYFITHSGNEIAIFDKEMKYLYVSHRYLERFKLQDSNIIGSSHYEIFPDIHEKWKHVHQLALKGITSRSDEDVIIRIDGSFDYARWECRPWYEADGKIGGIILTVDIITDRVMAEAELRKLSQAVQQSPVCIMITDIKGNIEYVNPEFTEITGYTASEVKGQNPRFLKSGETSVAEYKKLWETITSGNTWKGEFHNKKKNGELYWESDSISPIRNEEGLITHFLAVKEDRTEIIEREAKLQASLHEKEILLKEVHHRVKNNLQIISSLLSLQTDMVNSSNFADAFNDCRNRVKTMSIIHEKLYQSNNFSSISFGDYAAELINFLKFTYNTDVKRIKFDFDFDEITLGLDKAIPCGLILNELVSNAFKYAFSNIDQGILTCRLKRENGEIVITVKDNGPGIDEGKNLFSAETLGLIMVNSLVTQLKASLEMRNNGGAEFIIQIPLK